jgi:hypothetical protein
MSRKFDRARYGAGWAEVTLGALLSIVLGVVLAAVFFIFKPVATVKELPKEPALGMVYYIEGTREYTRARRLTAKEKFFINGGSVVVNEDELNTAANPVAAPPPPPPPGTPTAPNTPPTMLIAPGSPNFRIADGSIQIAIPVRIKIDLANLDTTVLIQATGGFLRRDDTFVFVPKTMYIGSCPVERLPMVMDYVLRKFYYAQPVPEEIATAWHKLAEVSIQGSTLKLKMP